MINIDNDINTHFNTSYSMRNRISMDYSLQQEYNDSNESNSENNHRFYQFLIYTRSARIGETSIHSFKFIQILVIDLDLIFSNESGRSTVSTFGISIHDSII